MKRRNSRTVLFDALESRQHFAAGALDLSYSGDGKHTIALPNGQTLHAADVVVQKDGKTVIAGTVNGTNRKDFAVARLNVDGTLDMTFNAVGVDGPGTVRTPVGDKARSTGAAVALQPDGKIVVVGTALVSSGFDEDELGVVRYNTDGTLDKSFDSDGKRTFDLGNFASFTDGYDVAVQSNGKIVVVGSTYRAPERDFFAIRLNSDGKLDGTFNVSGKKFVGFGDNDYAYAVKIAADGTILVGGDASNQAGLVKLSASGGMVSEFDGDGKRTFAIPGALKTHVSDILSQSDGRMVVVGHAEVAAGNHDWFIARFDRKGKIDPTFGSRGFGFDVINVGGNDFVGGIALAADGKSFFVSGLSSGMSVMKFNENGFVDTTFGTAGKVKTGFGGTARIAQGFGKRITLAGGSQFSSARILDAGANVVNAGSFQPNAFEQGQRPSGFIVTRSERLPVPTRVFFSVGGTASVGKLALPGQANPNDYTVTNMTIPFQGPIIGGGSSTPFVDIPAGQTFVGVNLNPIDDTRAEGTETATFSIVPSISYDLGTNFATKINIFDNDTTGVTLNAAADAFVKDGSDAGNNFGGGAELAAKNSSSAGFTRQIYLKFNLTGTTTITNAKLRLFGGLSTTAQPSLALSVFGSNNVSWGESTINFNNKPVIDTAALATTTIAGTTAQFYDWDITSYLQQQKAQGKTSVTLVLRATANSDPFAKFNSREAGNGPQIIVT